jgi:hypothetical protein
MPRRLQTTSTKRQQLDKRSQQNSTTRHHVDNKIKEIQENSSKFNQTRTNAAKSGQNQTWKLRENMLWTIKFWFRDPEIQILNTKTFRDENERRIKIAMFHSRSLNPD